MDQKTSKTLLTIAGGALSAGGLILILVSMFGETKDNWTLCMALFAIILANLFNIIRMQLSGREQKNDAEVVSEKEPAKKCGAIPWVLFIVAAVLVICFALLLCRDYMVLYPCGSAPFYIYIIFRSAEFLAPAAICAVIGIVVKRRAKK